MLLPSNMKPFDKKLGADFVANLPGSPGVYLVYGSDDQLIYVGKAKNLRRRLSQYRNAKRRKNHLKMRTITQAAERIETRPCQTEAEACLLEAALIQDHRPKYNVAGAFSFMYPMVGVAFRQNQLVICYTTSPEELIGYQFFGAFRSRGLTRKTLLSLEILLKFIAHPIQKNILRKMPETKKKSRYTTFYGFRQIEAPWVELLADYFKGESSAALEHLVLALIENTAARHSKKKVQSSLNYLKYFWKYEARPLKEACSKTAYKTYPVPQKERDFLFLRNRFGESYTDSKLVLR